MVEAPEVPDLGVSPTALITSMPRRAQSFDHWL